MGILFKEPERVILNQSGGSSVNTEGFLSLSDIANRRKADQKATSLVEGAIRRISNSVIMSPPVAKNMITQNILNRPSMFYSPTDFWEQVIWGYYVTGNVYIIKEGSKLLMTTDGTFADGKYRLQIPNPYNKNTTREFVLNMQQVCHLRYRPEPSIEMKSASALQFISKYIEMEIDAIKLGDDYYKNSNKVGFVIKQEDAYTGADVMINFLQAFKRKMDNKPTQFGSTGVPKGMEIENLNTQVAPEYKTGIEVVANAVSMVTGVPVQMLYKTGERQDYYNLSLELYSEAVFPFLKKLCDGLGLLLNSTVDYDKSVSMFARADVIMKMAQSNCVLVNEIRDVIGLKDLPKEKGEEFPNVAGAPANPEKNESNNKDGKN